ncbi:TPA: hypothetical protein I8372_001480 [Citrobacter farmeri]|nr:hypothetical protein [Citrobacter farmeri]HAT2776374.1 hypothetical protein [Citrobacter farmeri]HAT2807339.1 hypothetical protein [Citrobacter farmeri]HBC0547155.1 hypothetical protein [Citrobacter farmeri]
MDSNYIAYETLVANRAAADWAYWAMMGTWASVFVTMVAAGVAGIALFGWRKQEEASELKNFRVSIYHYHSAMIKAPKMIHSGLDQISFIGLNETHNALTAVYISTLMMHRRKKREEASGIYSELADIQSEYTNGKISSEQAEKKIQHIRQNKKILVLSN